MCIDPLRKTGRNLGRTGRIPRDQPFRDSADVYVTQNERLHVGRRVSARIRAGCMSFHAHTLAETSHWRWNVHEASAHGAAAGAVTREVVLDGDAAIEWVAALGWVAEPINSRFQVIADLIRTDSFAIGRIWHTPAHLSFVVDDETPPDLFHSVYGIEGTQILTSDTERVDLHPGQMHVQSFGEPLTITSHEPVARLFFVSSWARLRDFEGNVPEPHTGLFGASNAYREIFTSAAHAALNSVTTVEGAGFDRVRTGLDQLFAGVLADDAPARPRRARGVGTSQEGRDGLRVTPSLLRRASQRIEASASDVTFDAGKLARDLGISTASLYRAYEDTNLTPASQLRRVRARLARDLLEAPGEFGDVDTQDLKRIAAAAGFGSVRAMRRALDGLSDSESEAQSDISAGESGIARI
ncbi:AraC-like DNA-binding protein [Pseudoclavibacter sp. JAI123]|uniref:helix-turn-helix domain-containing protein n=1 Tax=Pseudoclavibacter sp. JAI123 TaxID=2723065 RepID=UPI0015C90208|nr:helix-turn-helix domain-containing protein [Pseudoclavibacter sp. JAI123]NYF13494.1 AraC-like DNA-binding protein [Pseudoclavibacter sp. JAI123]